LGWSSSGEHPSCHGGDGNSNLLQGGEKYQQAFYVFEELAQAPSTSSTKSMVSQAVAEIHLGRLEEAEAALQQALAKEPNNADCIANNIVLNVIAGKDVSEMTRYEP
jgi:coatomer protein complex subunit epsilon